MNGEARFYWSAIFDRADLSKAAQRIYQTLARYADDDGECFPSLTTIAERAGYDRRYTMRLLDELEAAAAIAPPGASRLS